MQPFNAILEIMSLNIYTKCGILPYSMMEAYCYSTVQLYIQLFIQVRLLPEIIIMIIVVWFKILKFCHTYLCAW